MLFWLTFNQIKSSLNSRKSHSLKQLKCSNWLLTVKRQKSKVLHLYSNLILSKRKSSTLPRRKMVVSHPLVRVKPPQPSTLPVHLGQRPNQPRVFKFKSLLVSKLLKNNSLMQLHSVKGFSRMSEIRPLKWFSRAPLMLYWTTIRWTYTRAQCLTSSLHWSMTTVLMMPRLPQWSFSTYSKVLVLRMICHPTILLHLPWLSLSWLSLERLPRRCSPKLRFLRTTTQVIHLRTSTCCGIRPV